MLYTNKDRNPIAVLGSGKPVVSASVNLYKLDDGEWVEADEEGAGHLGQESSTAQGLEYCLKTRAEEPNLKWVSNGGGTEY